MLPLSVSQILDFLVQNYYGHGASSTATSSHWQKYGRHTTINKTSNGYELKGTGFGDFSKKRWFSSLAKFPTRLYVSAMLKNAPNNIVEAANRIAERTGRATSYDMARMVMTVNLLQKHLGDLNQSRIAIIGDGYGSLGCLLKSLYPLSQIIYVNLGKTLAFDVYYSGVSEPEKEHKLLVNKEDSPSHDFNYIPAELVTNVPISADIFINVASMQEMNPPTIQQYFKIIRSQPSDVFFYCCNRVEKILPDGTITRFHDYDWHPNDEILIDGLCPWHQFVPMNSPPFIKRFDGPIHHRLVKIKRRN